MPRRRRLPTTPPAIIAAVHEKRIEIRWSDVDSYDHVNNAVYLNYLEEARDEWLAGVLSAAGISGDFVLVRVAIDFRRELTLADAEVVVSVALVRIGNSSIATREEVRAAEGWLAAESESVMAAHDAVARTSRRISPEEKAALERELTGPS